MARRKKISTDLECPKCGRKGTARWEETENPLQHGGDLARMLISVSRGFYIDPGADRSDDAKILCDKCKVQART